MEYVCECPLGGRPGQWKQTIYAAERTFADTSPIASLQVCTKGEGQIDTRRAQSDAREKVDLEMAVVSVDVM